MVLRRVESFENDDGSAEAVLMEFDGNARQSIGILSWTIKKKYGADLEGCVRNFISNGNCDERMLYIYNHRTIAWHPQLTALCFRWIGWGKSQTKGRTNQLFNTSVNQCM